jgi:hypothetical protein
MKRKKSVCAVDRRSARTGIEKARNRETAIDVTTKLQAAIDGVLFAFWVQIGAVEPVGS